MENERDEESRRRLLNDNEGRRRRSIWGRLKSQAMAMGLSRRNMAVVAGPLTCMLVYRYAELGEKSGAMVGALCWIFMWWMTEAVPMAVTSLAPLYLFPLLGIRKADSVAKSYMNDVIALVIGSFMLAIAVEEYGIHRRLALHMVLAFTGKKVSPPLLLLGFTGATAFVSMWMHNVAAAVMMMPVATGFLVRLMGAHDSSSSSSSSSSSACEKGCGAGLEDGLNMVQREGEIVHRDLVMFCKAIVLGVTYGAAIGGMSTLTGTGVNLILVGMWQSYFPSAEPISFMEWSLFAFPVAFVMFLCLWGILCLLYCSTTCAKSLSGFLDKSHLKMELDSLGPMSFAEKMVLSLFSVLIILWMTKSITDDIPGWGDLFHGYPGDGTASVMIATLLFIIPNKKSAGEKLMDWNKCKKLPWNIILLLGAGFAIADGVRKSGLADLMSRNLDFLESVPYLAMAPVVVVLSSSLTEFASNNATTTLFVPLLIQVALSMHLHPLFLMIPGAIGAQYSYLLPTGTPSNTVGFTTGYIDMSDMFKVGIPLKIAGIVTISLFMPTLGAYVFGSKPVGT